MEIRTINSLYTTIAEDLIQSEPELKHIRESEAKIIYLASNARKKSKGKLVFGECEKVSDKYKWGIPCDFTITVFEPNAESFTPGQLRILLFHELLHVGIEKTLTGESYYIVPHDLEDFSAVVDRFGSDWNKTEKNKKATQSDYNL